MTGVYGVTSYAVSRKRHEVGVRMALGARREEVLGFVLRRGLGMTTIGLAIGLAASVGALRLLEGFLFRVSPMNWTVYAGASVLVIVVAAAACYAPARMAARVDPAEALRYE